MAPPDASRRTVLVQLSALAVTACAGGTPIGGDSGTPVGSGTDGSGGTDGTDGSGGADGTGGSDTGGSSWLAECDAADQPLPTDCGRGTPFQGEGPFLRSDVPERQELNVTGDAGEPLVLTGRVLDSQCVPKAGAEVLLWSAGGAEAFYDTESPDANLYGKQYTDEDGAFCFATLRPVPYGPEGSVLPAHFHLAINLDGVRVLTTQLYFEDDPYLDTLEMPPPRELVVTPEVLADGTLKVRYDFAFPPPPPT